MSRRRKVLNRFVNMPRKRKAGCDNSGTPIPPALPSPDKMVDADGRVYAEADEMEPEIVAALDKILDGLDKD